MKALYYFLVIMFVVFAGLQYNDTDPWLWIPIYLFMAFLSFQAAQGVFIKTLLIIALVGSALGAVIYFPGVMELFIDHEASDLVKRMKADKPYIEEARESMGLGICFLVSIFYLLKKAN